MVPARGAALPRSEAVHCMRQLACWPIRRLNALVRVLLVLTIVGHFLPTAVQQMQIASRRSEWGWSASKAWAACAETARTEGVFLAKREGALLCPAADVSQADDIGHNLLSGIVARVAGRPLCPSDVAQINVAVVTLALAFMIALLVGCGWDVAALAVTAGSRLFFNSVTQGTGPHGAHTGVALLTLSFAVVTGAQLLAWRPTSVCSQLRLGQPPLASMWWALMAWTAAVIAIVIRAAFGIVLIAAIIGTVFAAWWVRSRTPGDLPRPRWSWRRVAGILLALALVVLAPNAILRVRDAIWKVEPARLIESHGLSHNLTIGLGAVPNTLGVKWKDEDGWRLAKELDPSVPYVSDRYYQLLWQRYFLFWRDQPWEMLRIYCSKAQELALQRAWGWLPLWVLALAAVSAAGLCLTRYARSLSPRLPHLVVIVPSAVMILMILMQGLATHHSEGYWRPLCGLFLTIGACLVDLFRCQVAACLDRAVASHTIAEADRTRWILIVFVLLSAGFVVTFYWGPIG